MPLNAFSEPKAVTLSFQLKKAMGWLSGPQNTLAGGGECRGAAPPGEGCTPGSVALAPQWLGMSLSHTPKL